MGEIKYCIASYGRCGGVSTIDILTQLGVDKSDIYISTQTKEDFEQYNQYYSDVNVLLCNANSASGNRNNFIKYFPNGAKIVLCDDDIKKLSVLNIDKGGNKKLVQISSQTNFKKLMQDLFNYLEQTKGYCFYFVNTTNIMFMSHKFSDKFGAGCFMGLINNKQIKFNEDLRVMEDNEIGLNAISKGFRAVELKFLSVNAKHKQPGGCHQNYQDGGLTKKQCRDKIIEMYPDLVKEGNPNDFQIRMKKNTISFNKHPYLKNHMEILNKYVYI